MGTIGKKLLVTHLMSDAAASGQRVGSPFTTTAGSTTTVLNVAANGTNCSAGDVVHITSGALAGQRAIIASRTSTTITVTQPFTAAPATSVTFNVSAPRTQADVSADVLSVELHDYLGDIAQTLVFELANTNNQYASSFEARDPIELWIDDGDDAATGAVTFTNKTHRCFIGRIDSIERVIGTQGQILRVTASDYTADLLDRPFYGVFLVRPLIGTAAGTSVYATLAREFNAGRGALADTPAGQPSFTVQDADTGGLTNNPTVDMAFLGDSFFDSFARVAQGVSDNATPSLGNPGTFYVDSYTYDPADAATKPTLRMRSKASLTNVASPSWTIVEGVDVLDANPTRDTRRTRNRVNLLGSTSDGFPVVLTKETTASADPDVLGTDRYGRLEGTSQESNIADGNLANNAAQTALALARKVRERRTVTRVGVVELGKRIGGATVNLTLPTGGLAGATSVGIVGVRHSLTPEKGLVSDFDISYLRPGWDRIIAPLGKAVKDIIKGDVYANVYLYTLGGSTIYRYEPTSWGASGVALFNVPTVAAQTPVAFSVYAGKMAVLYTDGTVKLCDAYSGTALAVQPAAKMPATANGKAIYFADENPTQYIIYTGFTAANPNIQKFYVDKASGALTTPGAKDLGANVINSTGFFVRQEDTAQHHEVAYITGDQSQAVARFSTLDLQVAVALQTRNKATATPGQRLAWDRRGIVFFWDPNGDGKLYGWKGLNDFGDGTYEAVAPPTRVFTVGATANTTDLDMDVVPFAKFYYA